MSLPDFKNPTVTQRLDRAMRRERVRTSLRIAGVALVIVGILFAARPFGPTVSNPVAIPKADPHAGIALVQSLPGGTALRFGSTIALVGIVLLAASIFVGTGKSRDDAKFP